ncbi:mycofactocin biosynthesis chaperone MftB [Streptomyces sp. alain-838]|nr:mycofactocin biosynthesis chaperone MftB [Streptomyces sp. alain-838]PAK25688.1 mycofactocin biosynthesis chaperone MftB [Streptomyces sp. alain-838]
MSTDREPGPAAPAFDLDAAWRLHPQASVRPERFGALLYHFGTRRLSFLKSRTLLAVVERLDSQPTARAACRAAGVDDAEVPAYGRALASLAAATMICERTSR